MGRREIGVTFVELLIVVAIISAVSIVSITIMNPRQQLEKMWDAQKKNDLKTISRAFEEYFNDNGIYPGRDVCDDTPIQSDDICSCRVCKFSGVGLPSYIKSAVCSFEYVASKYLYKYDCSSTPEKPQWYQICGRLNDPSNSDQRQPGSYNFGISSPNIKFNYCLSGCLSDNEANKFCFKTSGGGSSCNTCGTYDECQIPGRCDSPVVLYKDGSCSQLCEGVY